MVKDQRAEMPIATAQACSGACGYVFRLGHSNLWASLVAQTVKNPPAPVAQMLKNLPAIQETQIQSLGQEDPLEK